MRLGSMQPRKSRMGGGYGKREFFDACFSFVSKWAKGGKGPYLEEDRYVSRSLEGWEEDFAGLYTPVFTVS